jgi:hypothetical protein
MDQEQERIIERNVFTEEQKKFVDIGFEMACSLLDSMYARTNTTHKYILGDCLRAKTNRLESKKMKRNPHYKPPTII